MSCSIFLTPQGHPHDTLSLLSLVSIMYSTGSLLVTSVQAFKMLLLLTLLNPFLYIFFLEG